MSKIRVYELAKQYGLTNKMLMDFLVNNGIDVKSHMTLIDTSKIDAVLKELEVQEISADHPNKTSLRRVKIENLFGKYNYDINFENDINIWVAQNGKGKTTVLNLIVAVLVGDKKTLLETKFSRLEVWIGTRHFLFDKTKKMEKEENDMMLEELLKGLRGHIPPNLYFRILNDYKRRGAIDLDYLENIYIGHIQPDYFDAKNAHKWLYKLNTLRENQYGDFENDLDEIQGLISEEPLFYPTYRRIEAPIDKIFLNHSKRAEYEMNKHINFGMDDVEKRINELLKKMREDASNSYLEMNGEIISALLKTTSIVDLAKGISPIDRHKVEVIIKRIGEERLENIELLKEFVNDNNKNPNEAFLRFYLDKLVKIYDSQKAIDEKLRNFANVCTKYLAEKKLIYDEAMPSLEIRDEDETKIEFSDLSSGEKQLISIFSKVYLDVTTSCIFVIDEPELSLSIEWQKEFLIDVYKSGKVALLIATTHSPFVFKNEFRDYAVDMNIYREVN